MENGEGVPPLIGSPCTSPITSSHSGRTPSPTRGRWAPVFDAPCLRHHVLESSLHGGQTNQPATTQLPLCRDPAIELHPGSSTAGRHHQDYKVHGIGAHDEAPRPAASTSPTRAVDCRRTTGRSSVVPVQWCPSRVFRHHLTPTVAPACDRYPIPVRPQDDGQLELPSSRHPSLPFSLHDIISPPPTDTRPDRQRSSKAL